MVKKAGQSRGLEVRIRGPRREATESVKVETSLPANVFPSARGLADSIPELRDFFRGGHPAEEESSQASAIIA